MKDKNLIEIGVASAPHAGELVSGDRHAVVYDEEGVLVALVDALGHGQAAADAATVAISTVETYAGESLADLVQSCHEELRRIRGVAMSLAHFSAGGRLRWLSVGNVDGVLFNTDPSGAMSKQHMILRGGVVGYRLPRLAPREMAISSQDMVVMATDGIRRDFADAATNEARAPQALADFILQAYKKAADDALVLVVKYHGERP